MPEIRRDLARNLLAVVCIVALIGLSLWVLAFSRCRRLGDDDRGGDLAIVRSTGGASRSASVSGHRGHDAGHVACAGTAALALYPIRLPIIPNSLRRWVLR